MRANGIGQRIGKTLIARDKNGSMCLCISKDVGIAMPTQPNVSYIVSVITSVAQGNRR